MSDTTPREPNRDPIDLRAVLAEIDRNRAETQRLFAEARKFNRDPWFIVLGGLLAVIAGLTARLPEIMKAFGWLK